MRLFDKKRDNARKEYEEFVYVMFGLKLGTSFDNLISTGNSLEWNESFYRFTNTF